MKRENLERAKGIEEELTVYESTSAKLQNGYLKIVIYGHGNVVDEIYISQNNTKSKLSREYIESLKFYYEAEINELKKELETL